MAHWMWLEFVVGWRDITWDRNHRKRRTTKNSQNATAILMNIVHYLFPINVVTSGYSCVRAQNANLRHCDSDV